jgi:hypothetical protein
MLFNYFDSYGWYTTQPKFASRVASHAPEIIPASAVVGEPYPNWTGHAWVNMPYVEPEPAPEVVLPTEPPPIWEWYIDHGPWADRLGLAAMAIDISTIPELVAIRSDTARRKWVDLKDIRTIGAVWFLAGAEHPVLGTLATPLLTAEEATLALNTKPTTEDNLALRKVYFS